MLNNLIHRYELLTEEECKIVRDIILDKEAYVKSLKPDVLLHNLAYNIEGGEYHLPNTDDPNLKPLSEMWDVFNWISDTTIGDIIKDRLKDIFKELGMKAPISMQAWASTLRKGEGIRTHYHSDANHPKTWSGSIFISGNTDPGTTFLVPKDDNFKGCHSNPKGCTEITLENKPGELYMFDGYLVHYVSQNPYDTVRISTAFQIYPDVDTKGKYSMLTIKNL